MSLDVDRLAEAMLAGTQALIAKAMAPVMAENERLRGANDALAARLAAVEAREMPEPFDPSALVAAIGAKADKADLPDVEAVIAKAVGGIAIPEPIDVAALLAEVKAVVPAPFDPSEIEAKVVALGDAVSAIPTPQEALTLPDVPALVAEAVQAAVEALPKAQDGKDADPAEIEALRAEIATVKAAIPAPMEMPDLSGLATKADVDAVREAIPVAPDLSDFATKAEIADVRSAIPTLPDPVDLSDYALKSEIPVIPKQHDYAPEIAALAAKVDGVKMPEVIHGKDGAGVAEARQNADGELILKLTTGDTINAGKVRGDDGIGFDDLNVEDGEREFVVVFTKGERVERFPVEKPVILDRGVWREGSHRKGDGVTWAGSFWIAQRDTEDKPETSDAWRLAVKRGREGKSGSTPAPRPETVKR